MRNPKLVNKWRDKSARQAYAALILGIIHRQIAGFESSRVVKPFWNLDRRGAVRPGVVIRAGSARSKWTIAAAR